MATTMSKTIEEILAPKPVTRCNRLKLPVAS